MGNSDLELRLQVVERLATVFRFERFVYLAGTTVTLIILLAAAVVTIVHKEPTPYEWGLMFGSSGLVAGSTGSIIYMWNRSISVVTSLGGKDR
jgi:hypothetical protein